MLDYLMQYHVLVYLTVLLPVIAFIIRFFNLNSFNKWAVLIHLFLGGWAVYLLIWGVNIPRITNWLVYYVFFTVGFFWLFERKLGRESLSRILSLSLFAVFIASDFWEWPNLLVHFLQGNIGYLSDHIHRIYICATGWLVVTIDDFKFSFVAAGLLIAALAVNYYLIFTVLPRFPFATPFVPNRHIGDLASRLIGITAFGLAFYLSLKGPKQ